MAGGLVTVKMRPMRASVLAPVLTAALIPVAFGETSFSFLPEEPAVSLQGPTETKSTYTWEGDFFRDLPKIEREMKEHGFQAQICLSADDCAAVFSRKDGTVMRLSAARWRPDARGGFADHQSHDYLTATIAEPNASRTWLKQISTRLSLPK